MDKPDTNERKRIIPTASAGCGSGGDERKDYGESGYRHSMFVETNTRSRMPIAG